MLLKTPRLRTFALTFATFTCVVLVEVTLGYFGHSFLDRSHAETLEWPAFAFRQAVSWYTFALLILPVMFVARRLPLDPGRWKSALPVHAGLSLVFPILTSLSITGALTLFNLGSGDRFLPAVGKSFSLYCGVDFLFYWGIVGVYSAFRYYGLFREREVQGAKLERDVTSANLLALQAQLQPHFLFNTLNAVCGYALERDHEGVIRMLTRLSDLLRTLLQRRGQLIPLGDEVDFIRTYLEIQQMRLGDRLRVRFDIQESTLKCGVPPLLLQPLIENAIRHGIAPRVEGGEVTITAKRSGERLWLTVEDDGSGWLEPAPASQGVGLSVTRERLQHLFGSDHVFQLNRRSDRGTIALLEIPLTPPSAGHHGLKN